MSSLLDLHRDYIPYPVATIGSQITTVEQCINMLLQLLKEWLECVAINRGRGLNLEDVGDSHLVQGNLRFSAKLDARVRILLPDGGLSVSLYRRVYKVVCWLLHLEPA